MLEHAKLALAAALVFSVVPAAWAAECNAEIQRVQTLSAKVTDPKLKRLVDYDIKRAHKESAEADEMECQEAIGHADKLMASSTPAP